MTSKSKSKHEEALQFLDDLDSLPPVPPSGDTAKAPGNEGEAAEVLAFIDEITQKSSEPTRTAASHFERPLSRSATPILRKSAERVKVGASSGTVSPLPAKNDTPQPEQQEEQKPAAGGSWGWGSVWSNASNVLQQAKSVVDEQVKQLPKNEQARKWGEDMLEYAKAADLDKLGKDFRRVGLSTLTDILNAVAPPISEHEVIQVWLSHDMQGYGGVESLVYRGLAKVMEQVDGGDLIINRGNEARPKEDNATDIKRDMNAVVGYEAALKLAQADLKEVIKRNPQPDHPEPTTTQNPTTYSYVYLRIQPFLTNVVQPISPAHNSAVPPVSSLQFLLYLTDPAHDLSHMTVTQLIPGKWLTLWDDYEWVEDLCVEALRVGIEVLGQEYIVARMGWDNVSSSSSQPSEQTSGTT